MKKILFLFLSMILFSSCETYEPIKSDVSVHTVEGISIKAKDVIVEDDLTKLNLIWKNETDFEVTYGEMFIVERFIDGQWFVCESGESNAFIAIACILEPNSEHVKTYNLSNYYVVSEKGKYRIVVDCFVNTGEEESNKCTLVAEFDI